MNLSTSSKLGQLGVPHPWPLFLGLTGLTDDHPGSIWNIWNMADRALSTLQVPLRDILLLIVPPRLAPKSAVLNPTPAWVPPVSLPRVWIFAIRPMHAALGSRVPKRLPWSKTCVTWYEGGACHGWTDGWMDGWEHCQRIDFLKELGGKEKKKQRFCHVFFLKVVHSATSGRLGFLWSLTWNYQPSSIIHRQQPWRIMNQQASSAVNHRRWSQT